MPHDYESRKAQFANAKANGRFVEQAITDACGWYRANKIAYISRSAPATPGQGLSFGVGRSPVDFSGYTADGLRVAFDCKHLTGQGIYWQDAQLHQLNFMRRLQVAGDLGFLVLYESNLDTMWIATDIATLLRPTNIKSEKAIKVRSVGRDGMVTHYLPTVKRNEAGIFDFLPVARQACEKR